jgi:hypothetical protein
MAAVQAAGPEPMITTFSMVFSSLMVRFALRVEDGVFV